MLDDYILMYNNKNNNNNNVKCMFAALYRTWTELALKRFIKILMYLTKCTLQLLFSYTYVNKNL